MAYQVLARKYRPLRFSDVVGQDHVTRTLQNALEQGRIAHGYIFSGHRGIGKTTIARILASALNCQNVLGSPARPTPEPCLVCDSCLEIRQGNAVDVIEIDAATNRGIDEIRELRDAARYRPARDRFKIYILDEAHQITDAAFNALLKTLEEPPDHIVFMLATTEPENIPQTIRSRCQHFSFHAVKLDDILGQLQKIAVDENVLADPAALDLLAEAGDGSMRDALSIMDQAIASAPTVDGKPQLSATEIRDLTGTVPNTVFEEILEHVARNEAAGVLMTANRLLDAGNSPAQIARQLVRYLRNCVVAKIADLTPESPDTELLQISPDERRRAARTSSLFTEEELTRFLQVMLRTFDDLGFRQEQRFHLELGMLKLVHLQRLLPMEQFLAQLPRPTGPQTPRVLPPARSAMPATPRVAPVVVPAIKAVASLTTVGGGTLDAEGRLSATPVERSAGEKNASGGEAGRGAASHNASPPASAPPVGRWPETVEAEPTAGRPVLQEERAAPVRTAVPGPAIEITSPFTPSPKPTLPVAQAMPSSVPPLAEPGVPTPADATTGRNTHLHSSAEPHIGDGPVAAHHAFAPNEPAILPDADPEAIEPASDVAAAGPSSPEASETASLQAAAVEALFAAKTHNSAAEQLEETTWTIDEGELRIQTALSKPMMTTIFRADVEAIVKGALRNKGVTGLRVVFVPGAPKTKAAAPKKPRTGSAQAKALDHPTVQAAQRLFNAEVTNVFDLRRD